MQTHFFFPFLFKKKKNFIKRNNKNTYHEMHKCYAMQILKTQRNQNSKRRIVTKIIEMKHKEHVRKTQLD